MGMAVAGERLEVVLEGLTSCEMRSGGSSSAESKGFCEINGRIFDVVTRCATLDW